MILWLELLLCLAVIGYAGYFLSRYGDIIAEKTGMSASWVGLILLATATSLPELVTGISAVTAASTPNIAVGDVLGSTVFNLAILVILDALYQRETLYSRAAQGHILSAALGALLIAFAGFSLLLDHAGMSPTLGHVGLYTPLIVLVYIAAMRSATHLRCVYRSIRRALSASDLAPGRYWLCAGGDGGNSGRFLAAFCCQRHLRIDGLGAKLRWHYAGSRGHLCARSRSHYFSTTHWCAGHGDCQSAG